MSKETWYSFLRDEAAKVRKQKEKRQKKRDRANTKAFRTPQSFGPVDKDERKR